MVLGGAREKKERAASQTVRWVYWHDSDDTDGVTESNTPLQRHGLFPDKHAPALMRLSGQSEKHELMLPKQHTEKGLDPKTELSVVVLHVKNNSGLYSRARARTLSLFVLSLL